MFVLCLAFLLTATLVSLANSESISHLEMQGFHDNSQMNLLDKGQIFSKGSRHKVHIDFIDIDEQLVKVQVEKESKIVITDAVNDLSRNDIYEINLEKYGTGEFVISLTTAHQKKITETFQVQ